ncbi:MAG: hypothetical protein HYY02_04390 [Chloroflexi bacterium]|nr:hypothetical protein [Chloroflexota bacterium]
MPTPATIRALVVATALLELLLLRIAVRLGPVAPEGAGVDLVFTVLRVLGLASLNLFLILGAALLLWQALRAAAASSARGIIVGTVTIAAGAAILASGLVVQGAASLLASTVLLVVAMTAGWLWPTPSAVSRLYLLLPLLAAWSLAIHYALQGGALLGLSGLPHSTGAYLLAEALAVGGALAAPLFFRPGWRPRVALAAGGPALAFLVISLSRPWLLATLVMWNTGFTLWLPAPLYAAGLGLYLYTILALAWQSPQARRTAIALALLALGGLKPDYSPYALMLLLGYVNLAWPSWATHGEQWLAASEEALPATSGRAG